MTSKLFSPLTVGDLELKNRIIMGPLTRNRSVYGVPDEVNAEYYAQRADAGLIISEATLISPQGTEWPYAPGIYSSEQVEGWRIVTDAVHAKGSLIISQLWHVGRLSHPLHQAGQLPPAPSAIAARKGLGGKFRLLPGIPEYITPKAIVDPTYIIEEFKRGAINAKLAGFDGVELLGGGGYLPHQFLDIGSNLRTDKWGGDYKQRCSFLFRVIDVLIEVWGPRRVGVKFSPAGGYNDVGQPEDQIIEQYSYISEQLVSRRLAYVHLMHYWKGGDPAGKGCEVDLSKMRHIYKNTDTALFLNTGYGYDARASEDVDTDKAEAIVFSHVYISNPDLPYRLRNNLEVVPPPFSSFYTWEGYPHSFDNRAQGYTDFPRAQVPSFDQ